MSFLAGVPGKLKTLLDRLSATRAAYLDYINTLYGIWTSTLASNVAASNTYLARLNTDLTTTRCQNLDNAGGYISVQKFNNLSMTGTTLNQTITAVNQNRAFIELNWTINEIEDWGFVGGGTSELVPDLRSYMIRARFTSNTNVRVERGAADVDLTVNIIVTEWKTS
jgi:hypothetical protein